VFPCLRTTLMGRPKVDHAAPGAGDEPDWLEEAAEIYSRVELPETEPSSDVVDARDALEAAGIPCYLDKFETPEEKNSVTKSTHRWRAPGTRQPQPTCHERIGTRHFQRGFRGRMEDASGNAFR